MQIQDPKGIVLTGTYKILNFLRDSWKFKPEGLILNVLGQVTKTFSNINFTR